MGARASVNVAASPYATGAAVGLALFIYLLYKWIVKPLNRVKRLGDLGFHFGEQLTGRYKESQIERMKRLRVLGELPPVFPNGWFCIAESGDIAPKQIKPIIFMGEQLTLIRSENGKVHLIDSYCPHLGANFNVGGRVVDGDCVQCPFHGWVFSGETGKCMRIPNCEGTIPEQAKVSVWPVKEINKSIYVWYHCDGHDPEWDVPEIPEITNGSWVYKGRTEHEILCHCEEIPENGADIAHLNYLHLIGVNEGNNITRIQMDKTEPLIRHVWNGKWEQEPAPNKHISAMFLKQFMTCAGVPIPLTYSDLKAIQIGPGIVHMMFDFGFLGRGIVMQHVTPEEPVQQRVRFTMYADLNDAFAKFFLISEANHFERDIYVWTNKRYLKNPLYAKNDGPIGKHRRWFSQFYSENSPRLNRDGTLSNRPISINDW
uniref:cholesterol 7-desaturase n=1 Tax=Steinernema glaseri TaxID=37863 RepID=A0A1I7YMA5_9BILA